MAQIKNSRAFKRGPEKSGQTWPEKAKPSARSIFHNSQHTHSSIIIVIEDNIIIIKIFVQYLGWIEEISQPACEDEQHYSSAC